MAAWLGCCLVVICTQATSETAWSNVEKSYTECHSLSFNGSVVRVKRVDGLEKRITAARFTFSYVKAGRLSYRYEVPSSGHTAIVEQDKNGKWKRFVSVKHWTHSVDLDAIELGDAVDGFPASLPLHYVSGSDRYNAFLRDVLPFDGATREGNLLKFESHSETTLAAIYVNSRTYLIESIKSRRVNRPDEITITTFKNSRYRRS